MSMVKVEGLTFSYPSSYDNIFENVNLQFDTDWKLGFVGRNGRGKTTFLRLLTGEYAYQGRITASAAFSYFPYPVSRPERMTLEVLEESCPAAEDWEFLRELNLLEMDAETLYRPFDTLSNGERAKALLAALFLNPGRFLLIDEPTNHLDAKARQLVSAYLRRKRGFLLVSHDRQFLDGCVDHILSLNRSDIEVRGGNFSAYMADFQDRQRSEEAQKERLQKDIKRLQQSARRTAVWSDRVEASKMGAADKGYVGHKAAKMMKRSKAIADRQQRAIAEKSGLLKNQESVQRLKLFPLSHHADLLVSFEAVSPQYDGAAVPPPVSFTVRQGERVALDGRNGCGKSSLLKLLTGADIRHSGSVTTASGLVISHVPQDTAHLQGALADYAAACQIDESLFKAILQKMDFTKVQFEKPLENCSDGQKKKVLIARSLCERAHLYVWDEPLNFIDVYSRIQIETLLLEFAPTMVFVEHDGVFRERIATKVVTL